MEKHATLPWVERPVFTLDLDLPVAERYRTVPAEAIQAGQRLLTAIMQQVPQSLWVLADAVRLRTGNRFHAEAEALAGHVGASWRDIILANISYDLMLASVGCSTVALPTPRGPVLARNMDWFPQDLLAQASILIHVQRGGELAFSNAGWPGSIGVVSGLSARGFALALNAALSPQPASKLGYPVLLHLRRVLEDARDFDEALGMLTGEHLTVGGLITLVGTQNSQRVVVERTPTRYALRRPRGDEPLIATNDYRSLTRPEASEELETCRTTCARFDACRDFFANHRPERDIDDAELLYRLSDPQVIQEITAQHVILRPRERSARLWVPRRLVSQSPATCL